MIGRIGHRPAHSLARRIWNYWRGWLIGGVGKSQAVYFVDHNGQRYKRVVFGDSRQAEIVEADLRAVPLKARFPRLIERHENEVWVEFVPGRRPDLADAADLDLLAGFFADLYAADSELSALAQTSCHEQLHTDLWFLGRSGVLTVERAAALTRHADDIKPDLVWQGFDYVDPVGKNFVVADHGLMAIDVESLQSRRLLGTGVAKCRVHAPGLNVGAFIRGVVERGAPDFSEQYRYVELCFLAGWTKRKLLTGKRRYLQPHRFDDFIS